MVPTLHVSPRMYAYTVDKSITLGAAFGFFDNAPDPQNANVAATSGQMSALLFFRDHAHASPSGRFVAPLIAEESSGCPR